MAGGSNASAAGSRQPHPGTYQRYKLHTDRFLDWLKRSCGARPSNCKEIEEAVGSFASSEPEVRGQEVPPRVMGDLQEAIHLREQASAYHRARGVSEEADAKHRYFIELLLWCRAKLQPQVVPVDEDREPEAEEGKKERQGAQSSSSSSSSTKATGPKPPSNAFASLSMDDGEENNNKEGAEQQSSNATSSSLPPQPEPESSTGNPLLDEEDDDKGVFAAVCFAMDYEAALEGVREAWREAKRGETTYIAAAAATSAAVKAIEGALKLLELENPRLSEPRELLKALYNSEDEKTYRPLAKQMAIFGTLLLSMTTAFKGNNQLHPKIEDWGHRLNENKSLMPIPLSGKPADDYPAFGFVGHEVAAAYNFWIRNGKTLWLSAEVDDALCPLLEKYFAEKKVNVALLFAVHAWLESVLATQGEAWLGRTCCLLRNEATSLKDVYVALLKAEAPDETCGSWFLSDPDTKEYLQNAIAFCDLVSTDDDLFRYNPWLCGRAQHSLYAQFLHNGLQLLHSTSRLKTMCHLYNGLLQTGRLAAPSPALEFVLGGLGEDKVFVSGRPRPGNLHAGLLLSCGVSATSASRIQQGIRSGQMDMRHHQRMDTRHRKGFEANDVLRSFISNPLPEGTSIPEMLQAVKDDAMYDQTISRMLCLDCFILHKACNSIILATVEQAGLGPLWRELAAEVPHSDLKSMALDQTAGALLADLDAFALHGESRSLSRGTELAFECLAKNLKNDFAAPREEVFFHVHAYTDLHRRNWGGPPLLLNDSPLLGGDDATESAWFDLMELLEEAKGKLSQEEAQKLKHVTQEYPGVVTLMDMGAEFPSILHHLAGGPAADPGLLDWVIQMGGFLLTYGPSGKSINGDTAAHCAARRGDVECMRVLLRAAPVLTLPVNNKKQTPLQVAEAMKHAAMARYLKLNATAYGVLPPGTDNSRLTAPHFQGVAGTRNAPVPAAKGTNREPSRTRPGKKKGKGKKKNKK